MKMLGIDGISMRSFPLCVSLLLLILSLSACREKERLGEVRLDNVSDMPTMLTRDVSTFVSDSGYTRYHITAPIWLMYDNTPDGLWRFPEGLNLEKYDDDMNVNAIIVCDSATYFSRKSLWRLDGNVRIRNTEGDKFLTQQLFWEQKKKVYTDSFIHIERSERIIEGYGFESNEQLTDYIVHRPSGIFPVPERKQNSEAPVAEEIVSDEDSKKEQPNIVKK